MLPKMSDAHHRQENSETWLTAVQLLSTGIARLAMPGGSRL
jgi:hypothetical protein